MARGIRLDLDFPGSGDANAGRGNAGEMVGRRAHVAVMPDLREFYRLSIDVRKVFYVCHTSTLRFLLPFWN